MSAWDAIRDTVGKAAPLLGSALGGPAGGAVGSMIAGVLGVEDKPDAINKALQSDPEAAIKLQKLQQEHERKLQGMVLEAETQRMAQETERLTQTQQTMRAELKSEDAYVRRARPTFLYVIAGSVMVEVLIALLVAATAPAEIDQLATLFAALATPQSIAAGMCGVYLKKRSDDKAVAAGQEPPSLTKALGGMLGRK